MADNVTLPGTGALIAADEVVDGTLGTVEVQFMKIMDGTLNGTAKAAVSANGLSVDVSANATLGSLTETAPATDTASSGLNGRLQRIAQRLSSLIALIPTALGQGTMATSMKVVLPSDQSSIPVAATLSAETTKVIGTINVAASQAINVGTINGQSIAYGTGVRGATVQRVTVATDDVLPVGGQAADNSSPVGNPVYVAGLAIVGANPTKATNGQISSVAVDAAGRQIVVQNHDRTMSGVQQTTITSSTAETTIVTAVASTFLDLTQLTITNSAATATLVTLKDSTAGTTRGIYSIAAGGGITISFNTPLAQATVNTNWTLTCGTSTASIYVVAQYVKNT